MKNQKQKMEKFNYTELENGKHILSKNQKLKNRF